MLFVGLAGLPGAGKSTVGRLLSNRGFKIVEMGALVWDTLQRRGLPSTEAGRIAGELRKTGGEMVFAKSAVERIHKTGITNGTVVGIRSPAEVELFRAELGREFYLIVVEADPQIRYERLKARGRPDAPDNFAAFRDRDTREESYGYGRLKFVADLTVSNSQDLDALRGRIQSFFGWTRPGLRASEQSRYSMPPMRRNRFGHVEHDKRSGCEHFIMNKRW